MKKQFIIIAISLLSIASFSSAQAADLSYDTKVSGTGVVYRVIDGDTYDINADSITVYNELKSKSNGQELKYFKDKYKNFRIRLANTNTAESKHPDEQLNSLEGKVASKFAKQLIEKKRVDFTCWGHGKYGRLICSVSIQGQDVGIELIKNGHSEYVSRWGIHPYLNREYREASR